MTTRNELRSQILEKLGAPLIAAVHETVASPDSGGKSEAVTIAELLSRSVQTGADIATMMDLKTGEAQGDAIRLCLSSISAQLIAGHYRMVGKAPTEQEAKSRAAAIGAIMTFADNFTPSIESQSRLENIGGGHALADENQIALCVMSAFVPIVNAVGAYSFGRPDRKLVQEIAQRLVERASALASRFVPGTAGSLDRKRAEMTALRALSPLYVQCHQSETKRLMALNETARTALMHANDGQMPMDKIWKEFDARAAMLEAVGLGLGLEAGSSGSSGGPTPVVTLPPARAVSAEPVPAQDNEVQNPMSFFKPGAKKAGG